MSNPDFPDADPSGAGGPSPYGPDRDQVLYQMAFGAKPEDFPPNLQPLAQGYGLLFQPQPQQTPGLLGSLDDIRAAIGAVNRPSDGTDPTAAADGEIVEADPPRESLDLESTPPELDMGSDRQADDGEGPVLTSQASVPLDLDTTPPQLDVPAAASVPLPSARQVRRTPGKANAQPTTASGSDAVAAARGRNSALVVIGGGLDSISHIGSDYANSQYPGSQYVGHLQWQFDSDGVLKRVEAAANGKPIVIVGHSWGGPAAYDLANRLKQRGVKVGMPVTADPISSLPAAPPPDGVPWVNITATPGRPDYNDWLAAAGGKASGLPVQRAQLNGAAPVHHNDLPGMMRQPIASGLSAQDMINRILDKGGL